MAVPLWFTKILSDAKVYPTSFSKYGTEYKKYLIKKSDLDNRNNNTNVKGENLLCLPTFLRQQQVQ